MAKQENSAKKYYLKLGPLASTFYDPISGVNINRTQVVQVDAIKLSHKAIKQAIASKHIERAEESDYDAYQDTLTPKEKEAIKKYHEGMGLSPSENAKKIENDKLKEKLKDEEEKNDVEDDEDDKGNGEDEDEDDEMTKEEKIEYLQENDEVPDDVKEKLEGITDKKLEKLIKQYPKTK